MTINDTIEALLALKETHGGEVDVTTWEYAGGDINDLVNVEPVYDAETQTVVMESKSLHYSMAQSIESA